MAGTSEAKVVKCSDCGAANRVVVGKAVEKQPVCGRCGAVLPEVVFGGGPVEVTDANFESVVGNSDVPVLLDLWAAWCGPCRMIAPTIEQIAEETAGKAIVGKIDVDANPQLANRFQARSIPLLVILKNGREVDRLIGAQSKQAILNKLNPLL